MKTIKAKMFIIPNQATAVTTENVNGYFINAHNIRCKMSPQNKVVAGDRLVQVWILDEVSENWSDHGRGPEQDDDCAAPKDGLCFTNRDMFNAMSSRLLKGVVEGDTISLTINGFVVELTAAQLDYRYCNHGTFEEVLAKVTSHC